MSWRRDLVDALLRGTDQRLYHNNRHFRHSVDTLVDMLPRMVDGLARSAEDAARAEGLTLRLQESLPPAIFIPDYLVDASQPEVVQRLTPLRVDGRCNCNDPNFTDSVKPVESWWRCLTCKGLVWMGNGAEPTGEISWSNG